MTQARLLNKQQLFREILLPPYQVQFKETSMKSEPEIVSEISISNYRLSWHYVPQEFHNHATNTDEVITRTSFFIFP